MQSQTIPKIKHSTSAFLWWSGKQKKHLESSPTTSLLLWAAAANNGCYSVVQDPFEPKIEWQTIEYGVFVRNEWFLFLIEIQFGLVLLHALITDSVAAWSSMKTFSPSFHPSKVSHPWPVWMISHNCMCDSYHVCTDGTAHPATVLGRWEFWHNHNHNYACMFSSF